MIKCNNQIKWQIWNIARQIHGYNALTGEINWNRTYKKFTIRQHERYHGRVNTRYISRHKK